MNQCSMPSFLWNNLSIDGADASSRTIMNNLFQLAIVDLAHFLGSKLRSLSEDWWQRNVVDRLSFQQQRTVQERGYQTLQQLDFAALLRVLDQNWYELANGHSLPREGRGWTRDLQIARNKWAHLSAEAIPPSEVYRDADTLERLLKTLGARASSLQAVSIPSSCEATARRRLSRRSNLRRVFSSLSCRRRARACEARWPARFSS